MARYIDKEALITEIVGRRDAALMRQRNLEAIGQVTVLDEMVANQLNRILSFINNLEVKEVDLDKEIQRQYNVHKNPDNSIVKDCVVMTKDGFEYFAKHFFELGLQAQKEVDLEKDVRQILFLYYEGIKHYEDIIKKEREENGGSDLAIKIMDGVVDARELGIQYVIDKLKARKGE